MYSSGVLMLGVGGSDVGGRLLSRYATMQGLLGVICVYLSYVVVGWGGVMSYLTVPSLSTSLPNKGHVGFPRLFSCRKLVLPMCLLFALVVIIGNVCFQSLFTQASHSRPQQLGGIMASRMEPNWKAESTMAGHIGGDREIEDHDLSRMPLSKLTVLGNNWGGLRRRRHDTISTSELMHVAGHFQIVVELGTEETLSEVEKWGWAHLQDQPSAPAILWRKGSFNLLEHHSLQLQTLGGKWGGSAILAKFQSVRPGWTDIVLMGAHVNNVVAKQKDNSYKIARDLKEFAEHHGTHILFFGWKSGGPQTFWRQKRSRRCLC